MAVVASRCTMDRKDSAARKYLAERADLLGAIRLHNNAFRVSSGSDVLSDILFPQKRAGQGAATMINVPIPRLSETTSFQGSMMLKYKSNAVILSQNALNSSASPFSNVMKLSMLS